MWISLWINRSNFYFLLKNLEEFGKREYTIVNNGEVPKRLKGSHSKCDRSWKRRGSSNLLFSFYVLDISTFLEVLFQVCFVNEAFF